MKVFIFFLLLILFTVGCSSSNVRYTKIDESYTGTPKPADANILLTQGDIERPHHVIGIIEANLGKDARRVELNSLLVKKAREVGADGVILVEYDVDPSAYVTTHHKIVGHGPWKHHVVTKKKHVKVDKTASGIAVVFK
jgi:hypothetical protein